MSTSRTALSYILRLESKTLNRALYKVSRVLLGVALLALGAKTMFVLPFTTVPFTLQTLFLTLIILLFTRDALPTIATYLALGLLGLPIFAYGGGPLYIASPTFGYLLGFVAASLWGFALRERLEKPLKYILIVLAIQTTVYLFGYLWLTLWLAMLGHSISKAIIEAFIIGVVPFICWDLLKGYIALSIFTAIKLAGKKILPQSM